MFSLEGTSCQRVKISGTPGKIKAKEHMSELTEDEVLQILKLLDESNFDQLHLEVGDLKLSVSKSGPIGPVEAEARQAPAVSPKPRQEKAPLVEASSAAKAPGDKPSPPPDTAAEAGLLRITAPLLGTFYSRPDPSAPPYVEVGKFVRPDDTVGLIEVMKLFTAVKAGVQGHVSQVLVQSGQMVEYGQTLFLVKPDGTQ